LQTHYRKPVDFSDEALEAAENRIEFIKGQFAFMNSLMSLKSSMNMDKHELVIDFVRSISDDLNTPRALAFISSMMTEASTCHLNSTAAMNKIGKSFKDDEERNAYAGALLLKASELWNNILGIDVCKANEPKALSMEEQKLLKSRQAARAEKDWKESDRLRDELFAQGIILEDKPDGTTTWRRK
jgi:cysteinyl-tRNA synthetase